VEKKKADLQRQKDAAAAADLQRQKDADAKPKINKGVL